MTLGARVTCCSKLSQLLDVRSWGAYWNEESKGGGESEYFLSFEVTEIHSGDMMYCNTEQTLTGYLRKLSFLEVGERGAGGTSKVTSLIHIS